MPATRPARVIAINKRQAYLASRVLAGSFNRKLPAEVDEAFGPSSLDPHSGTGGPSSEDSCTSPPYEPESRIILTEEVIHTMQNKK